MSKLTHLDDEGRARMVDVSDKVATAREALARGTVTLAGGAFEAVRDGAAKKGDVLAVAQIAGVQAAKRTAELIPLCHPLPLTHIDVICDLDAENEAVVVTATAKTTGPTGVEMEALTAASVACLTIYDMTKSYAKGHVIGPIRLLEKRGGKSGEWRSGD